MTRRNQRQTPAWAVPRAETQRGDGSSSPQERGSAWPAESDQNCSDLKLSSRVWMNYEIGIRRLNVFTPLSKQFSPTTVEKKPFKLILSCFLPCFKLSNILDLTYFCPFLIRRAQHKLQHMEQVEYIYHT